MPRSCDGSAAYSSGLSCYLLARGIQSCNLCCRCRKTDGVDYQDYSKAALQQLRLKLKRKRRGVSLLYDGTDVPERPHVMQGATSSLTLSF